MRGRRTRCRGRSARAGAACRGADARACRRFRAARPATSATTGGSRWSGCRRRASTTWPGRRGAGPLRLGGGLGPRGVEGVAGLHRVARDGAVRRASPARARRGRPGSLDRLSGAGRRRAAGEPRAATRAGTRDGRRRHPVTGGWWPDGLDLRLVVLASRLPGRGGEGPRVHLRRRHLPGQHLAAVRSAAAPSRRGRSIAGCARHNPAPFAAFMELPGAAIVSASPERFLQVDPSGHVETRPIKGTRARGFGPEHDAALGQALTESAKDRAENLMIVDLMRNDLSRVCTAGQRARVGAVLAGALRHRAPPGVDGRRRSGARHRRARRAARRVSRRLDHRRAQAARDGDHRGVRAVAPRRLLRVDRLLERDRRARHQHRHPHGGGARRPHILQRRRRHRGRLRSRAGVPRDARQGPRHHRRAGSSKRCHDGRLRLRLR